MARLCLVLLVALSPLAGNAQEPLTLERLADLASRSHPDIAAARARAEAARGRMVQAGLYPNPWVFPRIDELARKQAAMGNPGVTFQQEIVVAHKLEIATQAARYGVVAADWQATTRWFDVLTRLRSAFFEELAAQRNVEVNEALVKLAQEAFDAADKLLKSGTGTQPDVLRARAELEQSKVRLDLARQREAAAWQLLAVAVGTPNLPRAPLAGSLDCATPVYEWEPVLQTVLSRSSEVQEAQALVMQAERLLARARVEPKPNLTVQVRPFYSFPNESPEVLLEVGLPVPVFNKNQGNIQAAAGDLAASREAVRQVELRLTERLTLAYQRYQNARSQVDVYQRRVLPDAAESLRLVQVGYEKGDAKYDYTTVLQAQQVLFQARLVYVQALGEQWRASADIAGLLQLTDFAVACSAPKLTLEELPPPSPADK